MSQLPKNIAHKYRPSILLYLVGSNLIRGWTTSTKLLICRMNIGTKHLWMYELHVLRLFIRIFCVLCRFIPERYLVEVKVRIAVFIVHSIKLLIAFYFYRNAEKSRFSISSIFFSPIGLKAGSSIINETRFLTTPDFSIFLVVFFPLPATNAISCSEMIFTRNVNINLCPFISE